METRQNQDHGGDPRRDALHLPVRETTLRGIRLKTQFVGHPSVDVLHSKRIATKRDQNVVGLFPGSRRREIEALFPTMTEAAKLLAESRPKLRFVAVAANVALAERLREIAAENEATVEVSSGDIHDWMQKVGCATIASGTATLEAAFFYLPYVLVYKASKVTAFIARLVMKVDHLGIINVLAGREVVRNFSRKTTRRRPSPSTLAADRLGRNASAVAEGVGRCGGLVR